MVFIMSFKKMCKTKIKISSLETIQAKEKKLKLDADFCNISKCNKF